MSQSSAHEGDFERHAPDEGPDSNAQKSAAGNSAVPSDAPGETPDGDVNAALDAELSDHLAAAAADLVRRGEAEETAARLALAQFGDIARIKRQCWWIQKGDEVMFRTVGIGLLSLLTVAVVAVALGGWQVQRNLASRTEELSGQLASLTATQQAMLAQQRPPEITGLCYLGDRSKPAADVEIEVFRFFDGGRTNGLAGIFSRRIRTDGKGRFATNGLKEGDYCLLAPLVSGNGSVDSKELIFTKLQSRPVNLLTGGGAQVIDLDLLPNAKLDLNFDPSLPDFVTVGELDIPLVVSINVYPNGIDNFPMSLSYESPNVQWPLPGQVGGPVGNALLFPSDLPNIWELPSWNYVLGVYLTFGKPGAHGAFDPTKTEPKNTLFEDMATISKRAEDSWARIITRATSDKLEITSGEQIKVRMQLLGEPLQDRVASVIEALDNRVIQTKGLTPQQLASQVVRFLAPNVKLEVQIEHIKSAAP